MQHSLFKDKYTNMGRTMDDTLLGKRLFLIPECFWEVKSFPLSDEEQYFYRFVFYSVFICMALPTM